MALGAAAGCGALVGVFLNRGVCWPTGVMQVWLLPYGTDYKSDFGATPIARCGLVLHFLYVNAASNRRVLAAMQSDVVAHGG